MIKRSTKQAESVDSRTMNVNNVVAISINNVSNIILLHAQRYGVNQLPFTFYLSQSLDFSYGLGKAFSRINQPLYSIVLKPGTVYFAE